MRWRLSSQALKNDLLQVLQIEGDFLWNDRRSTKGVELPRGVTPVAAEREAESAGNREDNTDESAGVEVVPCNI